MNLKGLGVALITPFQENGSIDYAGLQKLVEFNIANGTDYLVVQGTTGETATLSGEEKLIVLDFIREINNNRLPIVLGIGGNNTAEVINTLQSTKLDGVSAILSVSPYYNKPNQEGIFQHYKALDEVTPLPLIVYNVPARTGSNISADTTLRLASQCQNIIGIKEASGDLDQVSAILLQRPEGFAVVSGDDALTLPMMALGADGVISVIGNAFPAQFSALVKHSLAGEFEEARRYHFQLIQMIHAIFADGNPAGIKEVLQLLDICQNHLRLPLVPVNETVKHRIGQLIQLLVADVEA